MLRTSGGKTLPLARSLAATGFDVWTPVRTLRRQVFAKTATGKRVVETEIPVLPTFVFAREALLEQLVIAAGRSVSPHPDFSIFRYAGRIPLVGDGEIAGLRAEEARAAATIAAMKEAETHEEAERIRVAAIKSEAARRRAQRELEHGRRRALRDQPVTVTPGMTVEVIKSTAFAGAIGVIEEVKGAYAKVRFGTQAFKIEGWRVVPSALNNDQALRSIAA